MDNAHILIIYPQEKSTKIAVYRSIDLIFYKIIKHKNDEMSSFQKIAEQLEYRKNAILHELSDNDVELKHIDIIVARGGLLKPVKSGVYIVNDKMKNDLLEGVQGEHAINLGGLLASEIAKLTTAAKAYIADPVVVDELDDVARISGHPMFERKSVFHAANHKYIARKYAQSINQMYEDLNLIIAHMGGGGVSVAAHKNGKVIDVNQAFDGDGPFALTRSGTLPAGDLVRFCFSGKYTQDEVLKMLTHSGGLLAYIGTDNVVELERRIRNDDKKAIFIADAMSYQIAKEIGAMFTVLSGNVDAIILSGEFFHCKCFTQHLLHRIEKISKIVLFPTVNDMDSLSFSAEMIMNNETEILNYE